MSQKKGKHCPVNTCVGTPFRVITSLKDVNFVLAGVFNHRMNHKLGQQNTSSYFHNCNISQLPSFQSQETCSHPMLGHSMPLVLGRVFHCGMKESQTRTAEHKQLFPPMQYFKTAMLPVTEKVQPSNARPQYASPDRGQQQLSMFSSQGLWSCWPSLMVRQRPARLPAGDQKAGTGWWPAVIVWSDRRVRCRENEKCLGRLRHGSGPRDDKLFD